MADTPTHEALRQCRDALAYYRNECTGAEPSISVFARMVDGALAAADAALSVQAEPVAWLLPGSDSIITAATKKWRGVVAEQWTTPLYTTPPPPAPVPAVPVTDRDEWQSAVFTLMGHAAELYFEGKRDMPAWCDKLAEKIARTHLDEATAQRVRQVAEAQRAHNITGGSNG